MRVCFICVGPPNTDTNYTKEILSHKFNILGMPMKPDDFKLVTPGVFHSAEPVDQTETKKKLNYDVKFQDKSYQTLRAR